MVRDWRAKMAAATLRLWAGVMVLAAVTGCSSATPTLVPIATPTLAVSSGQSSVSSSGLVSASGEVVPAQKADLSFAATGLVDTVTVKVGDQVEAGQVLMQLKSRERLAAAVATAQQQIAAAQQEGAAAQQELVAAQTEALDARQAITDMVASTATGLNLAQAQVDIANLQKQIDDAQRNLGYLVSPDVAWYRDQVARAQDTLTTTLQTAGMTDLQQAVTLAKESVDMRAIELHDAIALQGWGGAKPALEAQKNYDLAVQTLQNAQLRLAQAQISNGDTIKDAQKKLTDAHQALDSILQGPDAIRLAQAKATLQQLQAQLAKAHSDADKIKANNGVDPDKFRAAQDRVAAADQRVAAAQARIVTAQAGLPAAQANLTAAQAALSDLTLTAPFTGSIVALNIGAGENVLPGQVVVRLGDLSHLQIETTDLSEKDLSGVGVGQSANIYVEALRQDVKGQVARIDSQATKLGGEVVYAVTLQLAAQPAGLRWGMSVKVDIQPK
jgi:multidrug efflux pump subunit AcrA (membrane-fusion protein)